MDLLNIILHVWLLSGVQLPCFYKHGFEDGATRMEWPHGTSSCLLAEQCTTAMFQQTWFRWSDKDGMDPWNIIIMSACRAAYNCHVFSNMVLRIERQGWNGPMEHHPSCLHAEQPTIAMFSQTWF
ncbi:hypothetical protein C0J52_18024 [Blattella germanica]|nr:hypothetical protein C0J52_18024 [Blattella germanica]